MGGEKLESIYVKNSFFRSLAVKERRKWLGAKRKMFFEIREFHKDITEDAREIQGARIHSVRFLHKAKSGTILGIVKGSGSACKKVYGAQ